MKCEPTNFSGAHTAPCDVLVVEDEEDIAELLVELLCDEGLPAHSAANGQEALDILRAPPLPRILIIDLRMPVMDGWELLAALRADERYRALPVLVLSGEIDDRARALSQAALFKPPEIDALLKAIRVLLS